MTAHLFEAEFVSAGLARVANQFVTTLINARMHGRMCSSPHAGHLMARNQGLGKSYLGLSQRDLGPRGRSVQHAAR